MRPRGPLLSQSCMLNAARHKTKDLRWQELIKRLQEYFATMNVYPPVLQGKLLECRSRNFARGDTEGTQLPRLSLQITMMVIEWHRTPRGQPASGRPRTD